MSDCTRPSAALIEQQTPEMLYFTKFLENTGPKRPAFDSPDFDIWFTTYFDKDVVFDNRAGGIVPEYHKLYVGIEGYKEYINNSKLLFSYGPDIISENYQGPPGKVLTRFSVVPTYKKTGKTASCPCVQYMEWTLNSAGKITHRLLYHANLDEYAAISTI